MGMLNRKILLHVCCAPCSGGIIETLLQEGISPSLFFYNPNIYPLQEYQRRKDEIMRFAGKCGLVCIDADHDPQAWLARVRGLEQEPERGQRCQVCFDMRLERAALYAVENGFGVLASTNGISRWKDLGQVHAAGMKAVSRYSGMMFWARDWRKHGGTERMLQVARANGFYRQDYCGCIFSLEQRSRNNKTL